MTTGSSRISRPLLVAIALGLALAVVGAVMFLVPQRDAGAAQGSQDSAIVARATAFATEYNTYDADDLEDYQQRLSGILTKEFAATNAETTKGFFPVLREKKQTSADPKVKQVAIESQDADSAKVLVVVDATVKNTDIDGSELRQFRWELSLQKEGGSWKVDAFESVAAQPATGGEAPAVPTPTPTATTQGADQ